MEASTRRESGTVRGATASLRAVRVVTDELDKVAPLRHGSRRPPKTISRWLSADAVAAKRERRRL